MRTAEQIDNLNKSRLINVLKSYAPDAEAQDIIHKMIGIATTKDYVLALADGLKYGNWPWIVHSIPKSAIERGEKSNPYPESLNEFRKIQNKSSDINTRCTCHLNPLDCYQHGAGRMAK